jgi:hypothetical protein
MTAIGKPRRFRSSGERRNRRVLAVRQGFPKVGNPPNLADPDRRRERQLWGNSKHSPIVRLTSGRRRGQSF